MAEPSASDDGEGPASQPFWNLPLATTCTPGRVVAVNKDFKRSWPTRMEGKETFEVQNPFHQPWNAGNAAEQEEDVLPARLSSDNRDAQDALASPGTEAGDAAGHPHVEASPKVRTVSAMFNSPLSQLSPHKVQDERLEKFLRLINSSNLELDTLRELSWSGIPHEVRPTAWRLLSGYLPANVDRRPAVLERRRADYRGFVEQHYTHAGKSDPEMIHQIQVDLIRMAPVSLFSQPSVQKLFERVLYTYHVRHPGSGYVQGMNDLLLPFFAVFLSPYTGVELESCDVSSIVADVLNEIEADSYWCFCALVEVIQDFFTPDRTGLQSQIQALHDLMGRVDAPLNDHLGRNDVMYLQIATRWMNCLLMRELSLTAIIRLWDTYLSEKNGFSSLHLYTCAALMRAFSGTIRQSKDQSEIMMFILNLPTHQWVEKDVALLLADAWQLKSLFQGAQRHLSSAVPAGGGAFQ